MKLDVFDVIALTVHANDDEIINKTAIQKLIYFHTTIIKNIDISEHIHYFYGPFNREVSTALEDMTEFSYIDQNIISRYYETCNYRLTDNGIKYAKTVMEKYPSEFEKISETIETCRKYCELKPAPLSYAAKAHHILENSKDMHKKSYSAKDVKTIAKDFDWNISKKDAAAGLAILQNLRLVSSSK